MYVMKFGAVALADVARLRRLVQIVADAHQHDHSLVVVCTAIAGMTDMLISAARGNEAAIEAGRRDLWSRHRALAEKLVPDDWEREALYRDWAELLKLYDRVTRSIVTLGEHSPRGIDMVASLGERFAANLIAAVLRQNGVAARMIDATELIVTDDHFGAARPLPAESTERLRKRLRPLTETGIVPVVTGYIGATREGVTTTLGRGGGDYTAALIGGAVGAEEVCIWTDVDGILTADPKIVPEARTLSELSYVEAAEIATFGPEVLHPRTITPIVEHGITLRIANMFRPSEPGTRIVAQPQPTTEAARAIISSGGLSLLTVEAGTGDAWAPSLAAKALDKLAQTGVEILTFTQSFSAPTLTIAVRAADTVYAHRCLSTVFEAERASGTLRDIHITTPVAMVAVISATNGSVLAPRTLAALGNAGAEVLALVQGNSAVHISFILPETQVIHVVQTLHRELRLA